MFKCNSLGIDANKNNICSPSNLLFSNDKNSKFTKSTYNIILLLIKVKCNRILYTYTHLIGSVSNLLQDKSNLFSLGKVGKIFKDLTFIEL